MADCRWAIFLLAAISSAFSSSNYVPVLLWQSQSLGNDLQSVSAVHQMTRNEFEEDILNKLDRKSPVLWFIQDDLSMEDFTLWGNVYGQHDQKNSFSNIQSLLDTNPSTMLPSVESPEDSISTLASGRKMVDVEGAEFLSDGKLDNNLFVVHLPSTDASSDRQQALSKNDKIIGDTIKQVTGSSPTYTAIYTGHSSSWVSAEGAHNRASRHALAFGEESDYNHTGVFFQSNQSCIVYFENMTIDIYKKAAISDTDYFIDSSYTLSNEGGLYSFECSTSDNITASIIISYNDSTQDANVTMAVITLILERTDYNDWSLANVSLDYNTKAGVGSDKMDVDSQFWAPVNASYHCAQQSFITDMYNQNLNQMNKSGLRFDDFQVQPYENGGVFGDAFDCVGFFTIGIWMGIFVVSILIIILGFGINMTVSINTMDRFDDPKGKTITVNAVD